MKIEVVPLRDMVLLKKWKPAASEGGIILPNVSKEFDRFIVVDCGPEVEGLSAGDEAAVGTNVNAAFIEGVPDHVLVSQEAIWAKVTRTPTLVS